jgi:hypothetical protein
MYIVVAIWYIFSRLDQEKSGNPAADQLLTFRNFSQINQSGQKMTILEEKNAFKAADDSHYSTFIFFVLFHSAKRHNTCYYHFLGDNAGQGCQIFLCTTYHKRENIHKIYQKTTNYTKWQQNKPYGYKMYQHLPF